MNAKTITTLNHLQVGQEATICSLRCESTLRRRLLELGMLEKTCVRCLYRGPCGSPIALYCRGIVIALRAVDASKICICI